MLLRSLWEVCTNELKEGEILDDFITEVYILNIISIYVCSFQLYMVIMA